jgi:hypothetical protein
MLYSKTKIGAELEKATTEWGKMMQLSLDERFGKDKCGFCLILTTTGPGGSMHMKTSLKYEGLVAFFRELANKLAAGMKGVIIH